MSYRRPSQPMMQVAAQVDLTEAEVPSVIDRRAVLAHSPDSPRAAAYRVLRHHLLEAGRPQILVVSSPGPREGKTTTALNLALALAESGRARVLLAEANLAKPALAKALGLVPRWCFAEQMAAHRGQPSLPWSLVSIAQFHLHAALLRPDLAPGEMLEAPAFATAMEQLRTAGYDHIVVDAPSVLGNADVNLIQDAADGVVMVVRARRTTLRSARKAIDQLRPAKVLGTVIFDQRT